LCVAPLYYLRGPFLSQLVAMWVHIFFDPRYAKSPYVPPLFHLLGNCAYSPFGTFLGSPTRFCERRNPFLGQVQFFLFVPYFERQSFDIGPAYAPLWHSLITRCCPFHTFNERDSAALSPPSLAWSLSSSPLRFF